MTINFAKIGNPKNDGTFQVYIRYQYRNKGDSTHTEYLPTGHYLQPKEIELLTKNKLTGTVYFDLMKYKDDFTNFVESYFHQKGFYPPKELIVKQIDNKDLDTRFYLGKYLESITMKVTPSSLNTNLVMKETVEECLEELGTLAKVDYNDVNIFVSETTTDSFNKFLINVKKFNNGYTNLLMRLFVRLQNFARVQIGLPKIEGNFTLKTSYKKYILNEDEVRILIEHKTKNKKYKEVQTILHINSLIGVRISELLSLQASDIHVFKTHIELHIFESKKNRVRSLPIKNKDAIQILTTLKNSNEGKIFKTTKDLCNYRIKQLAKETGKFNDQISVIKNVGTNTEIVRKFKWDMISTHTIRKYAVTKLAKKNLVLAQYYSGHSNLQTIEKHYLGNIDVKDVLKML